MSIESENSNSILKELIIEALGTVYDPEIPVSIWELGLVYNIAVRTGHHCAQPTMERYRVPSTVRASVGYYNNKEDFEALAEGILKVGKVFEKV